MRAETSNVWFGRVHAGSAWAGAALIFASFFLPQYEVWFFGYGEASSFGFLRFHFRLPALALWPDPEAFGEVGFFLRFGWPAIVSALILVGSFRRIRESATFMAVCLSFATAMASLMLLESVERFRHPYFGDPPTMPNYWPGVVFLSAILLVVSGLLLAVLLNTGRKGIAAATVAILAILTMATALASVFEPSDRTMSVVNLREGPIYAVLGSCVVVLGEALYYPTIFTSTRFLRQPSHSP